MEHIKAIIIDDEETGRTNLFGLIKKYCEDVKIIALAGSVKEGISKIREFKPDLIFLDVEMPPGNGFDLLECLSPINFEVIFTTAFNQYAIKAIKYSAIDYLLKPIDIDELMEAVKRVKERKLKAKKTEQEKIILPTGNGFAVYLVNEIIRCESDSNYTTFFFKNRQQLVVCKSLKNFEEILKQYNFFRVHQSHLINLNYVKKFNARENEIEMSDEEIIEVSRRKRAEFIEAFALLKTV